MVILVTGASSGYGLETAKIFAKNNWKVIALARREEKLQSLREQYGELIYPLALDIRNKTLLEQKISTLPDSFKPISVLVNNAGLALGLQKAYEIDFNDWQTMIDTNITALTYITHLILPQMVKQKKGHIVNMGSIAAKYPYPCGNVYGATKAFVHQFSLNLRADLAGTGIRVSDIQPGLSEGTEFSLVRFKGDKQKVSELYKNAHALTPQDIAEAIFWVVNLPQHVNINTLEIMPTSQSFAPLSVAKD